MKKIGKRVLLGLFALAVLAYVIDWGLLTFRIPGNRVQYADIRVDQLYASMNRWNQVEYSRGDPVMERCVYAIFPHSGFRPCWYVTRHTLHTNKTY